MTSLGGHKGVIWYDIFGRAQRCYMMQYHFGWAQQCYMIQMPSLGGNNSVIWYKWYLRVGTTAYMIQRHLWVGTPVLYATTSSLCARLNEATSLCLRRWTSIHLLINLSARSSNHPPLQPCAVWRIFNLTEFYWVGRKFQQNAFFFWLLRAIRRRSRKQCEKCITGNAEKSTHTYTHKREKSGGEGSLKNCSK